MVSSRLGVHQLAIRVDEEELAVLGVARWIEGDTSGVLVYEDAGYETEVQVASILGQFNVFHFINVEEWFPSTEAEDVDGWHRLKSVDLEHQRPVRDIDGETDINWTSGPPQAPISKAQGLPASRSLLKHRMCVLSESLALQSDSIGRTLTRPPHPTERRRYLRIRR